MELPFLRDTWVDGGMERKKSPADYERSGKDGNWLFLSLLLSLFTVCHHFTASEDAIIYSLAPEDDRKTSAMVQVIECIVFLNGNQTLSAHIIYYISEKSHSQINFILKPELSSFIQQSLRFFSSAASL